MKTAFFELYNRYKMLIANNLFKSEDLTEELLQDLFLKIWDRSHYEIRQNKQIMHCAELWATFG